eukprot:Nk52_evm1s470 gene=Nk52_evmTU1s470
MPSGPFETENNEKKNIKNTKKGLLVTNSSTTERNSSWETKEVRKSTLSKKIINTTDTDQWESRQSLITTVVVGTENSSREERVKKKKKEEEGEEEESCGVVKMGKRGGGSNPKLHSAASKNSGGNNSNNNGVNSRRDEQHGNDKQQPHPLAHNHGYDKMGEVKKRHGGRGEQHYHHHYNRNYRRSKEEKEEEEEEVEEEEEEEEGEGDDGVNPTRMGLSGLANLGNTCYMNAVLQCLSHCPPLTQYILDCRVYVDVETLNRREGLQGLVNAYVDFVNGNWSGKMRHMSPNELVRGIKRLNPMFRGYAQHDSQEFLRSLLDYLDEGLRVIQIGPGIEARLKHSEAIVANEVPLSNGSGNEAGLDGAKRDPSGGDNKENGWPRNAKGEFVLLGQEHGPRGGQKNGDTGREAEKEEEEDNIFECDPILYRYRSVVRDLFGGTLRSTVTCLSCGNMSIKDDFIFDLSVQIPNRRFVSNGKGEVRAQKGWFSGVYDFFGMGGIDVSLNDCLSAFCWEEKLTGSDRYRCDNCKELCDCTKHLKIVKAPEILCIHIKRFRHDSYFSSKVGTTVKFPIKDFDLTPHMGHPKKCTKKRKGKGLSHHGHGNHGGHEPTVDMGVENEMTDGGEFKYDLFGLVNHRGACGGGHYVGYAYNCIYDQWYEFDDSYVSPVSEEYVAGVEAYVLFYRRKSASAEVFRSEVWSIIQEAQNIMTPGGKATNGFPVQRKVRSPSYFISRQWFHLWNTCTHPGPVDSSDVFCRHGGILPYRVEFVEDLLVKVPVEVWTLFAERYGVVEGSEVSMLSSCVCCSREYDLREKRKIEERKIVAKLDTGFKSKDDPNWYIINSRWIRQWQQFKSSRDANHLPPPPINNWVIFEKKKKGNSTKKGRDDEAKPLAKLRKNVHYRIVNGELWKYLWERYKGPGPVIARKSNNIYDVE